MDTYASLLIDAMPFILYSALLIKLATTWRRVRGQMEHTCPTEGEALAVRRNTSLLMAILILLAVCTLTFMAANAYALSLLEKTLLSLRVFQMFVVGNVAVYWLVLDLISRSAATPDD